MTALTIEQFKAALPDKVKKSIHPDLIDKINQTFSNPEMFEQYRDNLLSYANVMADGRFKITNYIDAVKYVGFKLMGKTNFDAFSLTFPDKIQRWTAQGVEPKDMASYVTAYNKSKLVNLIMEQSLIPSWVLNQDLYQRALNTQAELMISAKSEMVRTTAANSILTQLKQPETQKVELNVGIKKDSSIDALRQATLALAQQQQMMIHSGEQNAQQIAHSQLIIEGEVVDED